MHLAKDIILPIEKLLKFSLTVLTALLQKLIYRANSHTNKNLPSKSQISGQMVFLHFGKITLSKFGVIASYDF